MYCALQDPLNGEAAALLMRDPEMYKSKIRYANLNPKPSTLIPKQGDLNKNIPSREGL